MQLFRRLRDEHGYDGGYDQVRRYVGRHRRDRRETFIPLAHDPGQRLECDFGHIQVDFPDGRRPVPVLIAAWAYSNYPFALAVPTERTEAILTGLVEALTFFGCVPREVWWDNPTTVVAQIFKGRDRRPNERYAAQLGQSLRLRGAVLHAGARQREALCRDACPRAPAAVGHARAPLRRPRGAQRLPAPALRRRGGPHRGRAGYDESIGRRFARDREAAGPLPAHPFEPCVTQPAQVDKYQTVRFDRNRYSVPRSCAFRAVTVKGYTDRVEVVHGGCVVARHARSYGHNEQVLDPLHYLATLQRRPAALDHAPVLRDWQLPESFARLRQALAARHGGPAGARHYVRVLQLLAEHPLERLEQAATACLRRGELHAERVGAEARRLAGTATASAPEPVTPLCQYQVPRPDLDRFNQLLSQGDSQDGR
jgi:hypothetical protein